MVDDSEGASAFLPVSIGRYEVRELIGAGGFASVYRAWDPDLDVEVAIKSLGENWSLDPSVRSAFVNEARLLRQVDHPGVVRVHSSDEEAGQPFYVMDYLTGGTLADRLDSVDSSSEDPDEVIRRVARQLAGALEALHRAGIAHGDITPANILIRSSQAALPGVLLAEGEQLVLTDLGGAIVEAGSDENDRSARVDEQETGSDDELTLSSWDADLHSSAVVIDRVAESLGVAPPGVGARLFGMTPERVDARTTTVDRWLTEVELAVSERPRSQNRRLLAIGGGALALLVVAVGLWLALRSGDGDQAAGGDTSTDTTTGDTVPETSEAETAEADDPAEQIAAGPSAALARDAVLRNPAGLAFGPGGELYVADANNHQILQVSTGGMAVVIAGTGELGYAGDGGLATEAELAAPTDLAVDADGSIVFTDRLNHAVRRIQPDGTIATLAGNGVQGYSGDDGPATAAQLGQPWGVDITSDGAIIFADAGNGRIRRIDPDASISTIAGIGVVAPIAGAGTSSDASSEDGSPTETAIGLPTAVAVGGDGSIVFVNSDGRARILRPDGTMATIAGASETPGFAGDGGSAIEAELSVPSGLAVAADGSVVIADNGNNRLRRIDPSGTIDTIAGSGDEGLPAEGDPAVSAQLGGPAGVVIVDDIVVFSDWLNNRVWAIDEDGELELVAGGGPTGFNGDGGPATEIALGSPTALEVADDGTLYFAEFNHGWVRTISPDGTVDTIGGLEDVNGSSFDLSLDGDGGYLLTSVSPTRVIRRSPEGEQSVVAGAANLSFASTDFVNVELPGSTFIEGIGDVTYLSDQVGHRIVVVTSDGEVEIIAGTGVAGYSGDGGPAADAQLSQPSHIEIGPDGALYVADTGNARIRRIDLETGVITTFAGTGTPVASGDGGPAVGASFQIPWDITFGPEGRLHVLDLGAGEIRRVNEDDLMETVATNSEDTPLSLAAAIAVGDAGVYVADLGTNTIYRINEDGTAEVVAGIR